MVTFEQCHVTDVCFSMVPCLLFNSASLSLLESPTLPQVSAQPGTTELASSLNRLLEDCAQLCHSIPQTLQTQVWLTCSPHDHSHTHPQTSLLGRQEQQHQPVASQPQCQCHNAAGGDGLREVTDLLGAVALQQDLPPIRHPTLRQSYASLLQRYRSLSPPFEG